jgi:hypothetical protein
VYLPDEEMEAMTEAMRVAVHGSNTTGHYNDEDTMGDDEEEEGGDLRGVINNFLRPHGGSGGGGGSSDSQYLPILASVLDLQYTAMQPLLGWEAQCGTDSSTSARDYIRHSETLTYTPTSLVRLSATPAPMPVPTPGLNSNKLPGGRAGELCERRHVTWHVAKLAAALWDPGSGVALTNR